MIDLSKDNTIGQQLQGNPDFLTDLRVGIQTPVKGILETISQINITVLNERQQHFLERIHNSVHQLLIQVNDVHSRETIFSGKLEQEKKIPFKIVENLAGSIESFIHKAEEKGIALIYQNTIPGELVVLGEPFQLGRILHELLSNAVKFTERGKIIITTRMQVLSNSIATLECSVKDTGPGIHEEKLKEITGTTLNTPFADYSKEGQGLDICKNLVTMQEGSLQIETKQHTGSTFTFVIPYMIYDQELNPTEQSMDVDVTHVNPKKILVAEGEKLQQYITRNVLELRGFEVVLASNRLEVLEEIRRNNFDLLLLDVLIPGIDVTILTSGIRQLKDPVKATIPIIAVTSDDTIHEYEKYRLSGIDDCILKPFNEEKLFKTIIRHISDGRSKSNNMKNIQPFNELLPPGKLYDLSIIKAVSGGDDEFVKKMVCLFIETVPANLKDLNTFVEKENWEMVSKMAHKLKSTLDSMGIQTLKQDIRTVELTAKNNESLENIPLLVSRLNVVVECCILQLETEVLQHAS